MRSPAAAFAWELRRRHRWGLIAVGAFLVTASILRLALNTPARAMTVDNGEVFAVMVVVPLTAMFLYCLGAFTFGHTGDLAARQSIFPARYFTLPVSSPALAGWPMLYGTTVVAVLWLVTSPLLPWPAGIRVPVVWPALAIASLLAWSQALTWMSYPVRGLRVVFTILCLAVVETIVFVALHFRTSEPVMVGILAPQIPLAYLVARAAVTRARSGDIPDWGGVLAGARRRVAVMRGRRPAFASPARAQLWFEWQRYGWSLPAFVAILLPFELALLWVSGDAPVIVGYILAGVALTPPFGASFSAAAVRKSSASSVETYGVTPFIGTRPATSAALVGAKLHMAMWSTAVAWVLVIAAVPAALVWSDTWSIVADRAQRFAGAVTAPRATVVGLLALALLAATTWRQLVQSLYIGLTGREWLIKGSAFVTLAAVGVLLPLLDWVMDSPAARGWLWAAMRWILGLLAVVRMAMASWVLMLLRQRGLVSDATLVTGAACWLAAVATLHGVLVWLFATPYVARYLLLLIAILAVPLVRVAAAPLALDWNRHR